MAQPKRTVVQKTQPSAPLPKGHRCPAACLPLGRRGHKQRKYLLQNPPLSSASSTRRQNKKAKPFQPFRGNKKGLFAFTGPFLLSTREEKARGRGSAQGVFLSGVGSWENPRFGMSHVIYSWFCLNTPGEPPAGTWGRPVTLPTSPSRDGMQDACPAEEGDISP